MLPVLDRSELSKFWYLRFVLELDELRVVLIHLENPLRHYL